MKQIDINGNIVFYSKYKYDENPELRDFLKSEDLRNLIISIKENIIVVLWWDGTMLDAIRQYHMKEIPFLWINFWTKGFLLNNKDITKKENTFTKREYPLLHCQINGDEKQIAVNEIDIRASWGKMVDLDVTLSWQKINIKSDAIIISTPVWSTGYNSSLGGPIIPHTIKAFVITSKAPWSPRNQQPIIVNDTEEIIIENVWRKSPISIYSDGKIITDSLEEKLRIHIWKNKKTIDLLIADLDSWDAKVLQEQGFWNN